MAMLNNQMVVHLESSFIKVILSIYIYIHMYIYIYHCGSFGDFAASPPVPEIGE